MGISHKAIILFLAVIGLSLSQSVSISAADILGEDNRQLLGPGWCNDIGHHIHRIYVPYHSDRGKYVTGFSAQIDYGERSEKFIISAAHNFAQNGKFVFTDIKKIQISSSQRGGLACDLKYFYANDVHVLTKFGRERLKESFLDFAAVQSRGIASYNESAEPLRLVNWQDCKSLKKVRLIGLKSSRATKRPTSQFCNAKRSKIYNESNGSFYILHDCDTEGGYSGAPLLCTGEDGIEMVFAVHVAGGATDERGVSLNAAIPITNVVIRELLNSVD